MNNRQPKRIDDAEFLGAEAAMERAGKVAVEQARATGREPVVGRPASETVSAPGSNGDVS
jgi:hypothetical protein